MKTEKLNNPTVKELIEALEKMPPDSKVLSPISCEQHFSDLIELNFVKDSKHTLLEGVCYFD